MHRRSVSSGERERRRLRDASPLTIRGLRRSSRLRTVSPLSSGLQGTRTMEAMQRCRDEAGGARKRNLSKLGHPRREDTSSPSSPLETVESSESLEYSSLEGDAGSKLEEKSAAGEEGSSAIASPASAGMPIDQRPAEVESNADGNTVQENLVQMETKEARGNRATTPKTASSRGVGGFWNSEEGIDAMQSIASEKEAKVVEEMKALEEKEERDAGRNYPVQDDLEEGQLTREISAEAVERAEKELLARDMANAAMHKEVTMVPTEDGVMKKKKLEPMPGAPTAGFAAGSARNVIQQRKRQSSKAGSRLPQQKMQGSSTAALPSFQGALPEPSLAHDQFELHPARLNFGILAERKIYRARLTLTNICGSNARYRVTRRNQSSQLEDGGHDTENHKLRVIFKPGAVAPGMRSILDVEIATSGPCIIDDFVEVVSEYQVFRVPVVAEVVEMHVHDERLLGKRVTVVK